MCGGGRACCGLAGVWSVTRQSYPAAPPPLLPGQPALPPPRTQHIWQTQNLATDRHGPAREAGRRAGRGRRFRVQASPLTPPCSPGRGSFSRFTANFSSRQTVVAGLAGRAAVCCSRRACRYMLTVPPVVARPATLPRLDNPRRARPYTAVKY